MQGFTSGLIVGLLLGVLLCYGFLQWSGRKRLHGRKQEIDQLTEDFQALFRQLDQDKEESS
jgi:hypothetical protein